MSATRYMRIGNGLYAKTNRPSVLDQYRKMQAACKHERIDSKGTCYGCGKSDRGA